MSGKESEMVKNPTSYSYLIKDSVVILYFLAFSSCILWFLFCPLAVCRSSSLFLSLTSIHTVLDSSIYI